VTPIGTAHVAFGCAALVLGAANALGAKGTGVHRLVGHGYYVSMLGLNGTALEIHDLFGGFGVFHWLSLLSLATVFAAIVPVLLRRPERTWRVHHAYYMSYSYVGLLAATAAEIGVRLPPLWTTDSVTAYFAFAAGAPSVLVTVAGAIAIHRAMRPLRSEVTSRGPLP